MYCIWVRRLCRCLDGRTRSTSSAMAFGELFLINQIILFQIFNWCPHTHTCTHTLTHYRSAYAFGVACGVHSIRTLQTLKSRPQTATRQIQFIRDSIVWCGRWQWRRRRRQFPLFDLIASHGASSFPLMKFRQASIDIKTNLSVFSLPLNTNINDLRHELRERQRDEHESDALQNKEGWTTESNEWGRKRARWREWDENVVGWMLLIENT